jgi:hypothetical protein
MDSFAFHSGEVHRIVEGANDTVVTVINNKDLFMDENWTPTLETGST